MCAKSDRIFTARKIISGTGAGALLLLGLSDIRYLTGFSGSDGAVLVTPDDCYFLTDSRYTEQAAGEVAGCKIREYRGKVEGLSSLLIESGIATAAFDAEHTSVAFLRSLEAGLPGVTFLPVSGELDRLRLLKDPDEILLLEKAAAIASAALLELLEGVRPGMLERDFALSLEYAMKRAGADDKAFDFIVASGFRGALPHGRASEKAIQAGEMVTVDFGAIFQGYCSDETVTVAVGEPDAKQSEIYSIVKEAHDRAIAAVQPGIPLKELDRIARDFIGEHGYGSYFGHGLGHGVGLEVHEKPVVSFRSEMVVEEGMVFTIEPGIYIPAWGGVRIEDTVVVEGSGCRALTTVPKELMVL